MLPSQLCYILPRYDDRVGEHLNHTYEMLRLLSQRVELAVIVERAAGQPVLGAARILVQRFANVPVLRFLEMVVLCLKVRRAGCRAFYARQTYYGALGAWIATRLAGGTVYYWHCTSMSFRTRGWGLKDLQQRIRAEMPLALVMRLVDFLVTGGTSLQPFYAASFGISAERIKVVPNEIDPDRFMVPPESGLSCRRRWTIAEDVPVVLFVHRVVERKGAHLLAPIARAVLRAEPSAHFLVVGSGPYAPRLAEEIGDDLRLKSRFRLAGAVPNGQIAEYYAAATLLLMPSLEEGFPRVLLEAMAAGVPFVAADVGAVREMCGTEQQWGIVHPADVSAFADRIIQLLRDSARRSALRLEGLERVRRFSTSIVVQRTIEQLGLTPHMPATAGSGVP
jgi:glycosyltransferase involved in cell wall biosynthesis